MGNSEQPKYRLLRFKGNIEVREYEPMIIAEVKVLGLRKEAIKKGFKVLADFIFGNNISNQKIEMMAPVMQEGRMKEWKIKFVMPSKYSPETLPKPNCAEIRLIPVSRTNFAVIKFSGLVDDKSIRKYIQELQDYIFAEHLCGIGKPILAFYNPPWTLPFLRRNEVMIEVDPNTPAQ